MEKFNCGFVENSLSRERAGIEHIVTDARVVLGEKKRREKCFEKIHTSVK